MQIVAGQSSRGAPENVKAAMEISHLCVGCIVPDRRLVLPSQQWPIPDKFLGIVYIR